MGLSSTSCDPHSCYWKSEGMLLLVIIEELQSDLFYLDSVLLLSHKGFGIHHFLSHTFERVTTNKHSSVLCRLIGRVMDFTDFSKTEPNTDSPLVQRANWFA